MISESPDSTITTTPEVPIPPAGYRLLNICPRLMVHDDLEGSHLSPPKVECTIALPPDAILLGALPQRIRQPFADDRFYAPAQSNGQLGLFVAIPEWMEEAISLITWTVSVAGYGVTKADHTLALRFAPGSVSPIFYQDRDRAPGLVLYSTGDAGFLRQDRTTSLLVPTTVLRTGDLQWRDEAIISEAKGHVDLFDAITLRPIDARDFLTWTAPELILQPHENQTQPRLHDKIVRAAHYANAAVNADAVGLQVLAEAVEMAQAVSWEQYHIAGGQSPHPAVEHLCAWWNTTRPTGTRPAGSITLWARLDDDGGYWDAAGHAPNMELDVTPADRPAAVTFGDTVLMFFCLSRDECISEANPNDSGITQRLANGQVFWTIPGTADMFQPDEDAVLGLTRLPELLADSWADVTRFSEGP